MKGARIFPFLIFLIVSGFILAGCVGNSVIPDYKGFVNDFANIISDDKEKSLESFISQYEQNTTNEIAVVTVKTIGSDSVENYTMKLAEKWKVGKKEKDNGVIILVAKQERKIRIEVGYGLESVLTDAKSKLIIEKEMTPRFKNGDYDDGIEGAVKAIVGTLEGSYDPDTASAAKSGKLPFGLIVGLIFIGIIGFVVVVAVLTDGGGYGGGGYWYSGGASGGSSGSSSSGIFGGGSFGGGGASGGW